jgi:hypothetical protein
MRPQLLLMPSYLCGWLLAGCCLGGEPQLQQLQQLDEVHLSCCIPYSTMVC